MGVYSIITPLEREMGVYSIITPLERDGCLQYYNTPGERDGCCIVTLFFTSWGILIEGSMEGYVGSE
jgi:hypothetical protein